jgi:hypothetical protein
MYKILMPLNTYVTSATLVDGLISQGETSFENEAVDRNGATISPSASCENVSNGHHITQLAHKGQHEVEFFKSMVMVFILQNT